MAESGSRKASTSSKPRHFKLFSFVSCHPSASSSFPCTRDTPTTGYRQPHAVRIGKVLPYLTALRLSHHGWSLLCLLEGWWWSAGRSLSCHSPFPCLEESTLSTLGGGGVATSQRCCSRRDCRRLDGGTGAHLREGGRDERGEEGNGLVNAVPRELVEDSLESLSLGTFHGLWCKGDTTCSLAEA